MAINLDPYRTGFINWRVMFTYFALLRSIIPTEAEIKALRTSCKSEIASHDDFMKAKFWFDKTEDTQNKPGYHAFDRLGMLKDLLFRANSRMIEGHADPMVDIQDFCRILQTPLVQHPKSKFADYNEFLFAPIKQANN